MITPYLHDNRIYLNRLKINTEYFYTSIEHQVAKDSGIERCQTTVEMLRRNKIQKSLLKSSASLQMEQQAGHGHDHRKDTTT